jgi:hypothetical protein
MSGFSKLHSSIATSSLMALPVATRWIWTFLLSQAMRRASSRASHDVCAAMVDRVVGRT